MIWNVNLKRAERGHVYIDADTMDDALVLASNHDFDPCEVILDWGDTDPNNDWEYDPSAGIHKHPLGP